MCADRNAIQAQSCLNLHRWITFLSVTFLEKAVYMSDCCLTPLRNISAINGKDKLHFNEMMMMSASPRLTFIAWFFLVLVH